MNGTDYRAIDKIVGIILVIFAACGLLCGGALMLGGGALGTAIATLSSPGQRAESAVGGAVVGGALFAIGAVIFFCYLLNILGAIWVMNSQRRGFFLTAVLTGINALIALSGATAYLDILPAMAACVYCILRLTGNLGPKPE